MNKLELLRTFVRVSELSSFTLAGESLGLPRSTVSEHVQALEELLAAWPGALVMVSHDRHLLQALRPTQVLQVSTEGWQWRDAL